VDVLLVNPHYNGRSEIPPLGLECLAAILMEHEVTVHILDLDIVPRPDADKSLERQLRTQCPKIVGVTAMSNSFDAAVTACRTTKSVNPDTLTVMGGIHPTVLYDAIMERHGEVDLVVRGEGEFTFLDVTQCYFRNIPFNGIAGISFRGRNSITHNGERELIRNLDSLPLPAHTLVRNDVYRTRSISSSRGCFHTCTFCSIQSLYHNVVRLRTIKSITDEIEGLITCGAKRIMFTDDNFTFSFKRIRQLCEEIIRKELNRKAVFYAEGRIDDICNAPIMAQILSDAGFRGLYIGAESGSEEILNYYRKGITPDVIYRGVTYCIEQNLSPIVNFILYGPNDTVATIKETIQLAKKLFENGSEIVYAETLTPYPGTPIKEELEEDGKFRESRGVFYFESYRDLDIDWIMQLCNAARDIAYLIHRNDPLFISRKAYYELTYLDELLDRKIPVDFEQYCHSKTDEGNTLNEVRNTYECIQQLFH